MDAPPAERKLFQDKEGAPLLFWIEGKIAASVHKDLKTLIKVRKPFEGPCSSFLGPS